MTLSILAFDPADGVVGAAVTSCVLASGRRVLHIRPGVGAAATQASSEITWGADILDALADGSPPATAIAPFQRDDTQLAAIDFEGALWVYTGAACPPHAGDVTAEHVTVQVNTAALPDAPQRMLRAFHDTSDEPLAERLVAALAASGDDARGKQSAAVFVSGVHPLAGYADEPHVDLRVDDSRQPVVELQRLLDVHRAHCRMRQVFDSNDGNLLAVIEPLATRHPDDPHLSKALAVAQQRASQR